MQFLKIIHYRHIIITNAITIFSNADVSRHPKNYTHAPITSHHYKTPTHHRIIITT